MRGMAHRLLIASFEMVGIREFSASKKWCVLYSVKTLLGCSSDNDAALQSCLSIQASPGKDLNHNTVLEH